MTTGGQYAARPSHAPHYPGQRPGEDPRLVCGQARFHLRPGGSASGAVPQWRGPVVPAVSSSAAGTAQHQLAAWVVEDLEAEVAELRSRGVEFEEYDQPGLRTVDGIARTPVGKAAWFKDSEGNVLTITQLDPGH